MRSTNISKTPFYNDIRQILQSARYKAYTAVNTAMVDAYWSIGKRIVEEEQHGKDRAEYGQELIKNLSIELNSEFGKGFSIANLKNFRQFYLTFAEDEKSYTLCSQLSWSHIRLIMRIDHEPARIYYLTESKAENWSIRQLQRNINSRYYERLLSSSDKNKALYLDAPTTELKSISIPTPPKPEQTAIVHHIETETTRIDGKIAKTKKIIALKKEYRTALISEVVTGKIKVAPEMAA